MRSGFAPEMTYIVSRNYSEQLNCVHQNYKQLKITLHSHENLHHFQKARVNSKNQLNGLLHGE